MKSFSFKLSMPLIQENIRRFWALPAVAFLAYFISGIIPVLSNQKKTDILAEFINALLHQSYPVYQILELLVPVIAASMVFRYLHHNSSATVMHALPFTRKQLFYSSFFSGLLLCMIPVFLTGGVLYCIAHPIHFSENADYLAAMGTIHESAITAHSNVFSHNLILSWLGETSLLTFCVYTISVFAGTVTGGGIFHFFTALAFNWLATGFLASLTYYFDALLFGYTPGTVMEQLIASLSPFWGITSQSGELKGILIAGYLLFSVILILVSCFLYQRRKLERTNRAFVFRFMDPLICWIITFFGMTVAGLFLFRNDGQNLGMYLGFAGGSIAAFILSTMFTRKSLRVFDAKTLKNFCIYAAAAVLFIAVLAFDLTGYETRLPQVSQISKVTATDTTLLTYDPRFDASYYKHGKEGSKETYKTPENLQAFLDLQKSILDTYQNHPASSGSCAFNFHYFKKGGDLQRSYTVDENFFRNNKSYAKIYESKEFKDFYSIYNLKNFRKCDLSISSAYSYSELPLTNQDKKELLTCIDEDFKDRTYAEQVDKHRPCGYINLSYKTVIPGTGSTVDGIMLYLLDSDTRTMKWMQAHKYFRYFHPSAKDVEEIKVYSCDSADRKAAIEEYGIMDLSDSSYYKELGTVKEARNIQQILDTCESAPDIYACQITFKHNDYFEGESMVYFYSSKTAPDFLKHGLGQEKK